MPVNSLRRLSQRYEYGKLKYGNAEAFKDGLPVSDCIDSMFRHLLQYLEGDNSEDHMAAIAWGAFAIMYYEENVPQFQDIELRKKFTTSRGSFKYIQKVIKKGEFK